MPGQLKPIPVKDKSSEKQKIVPLNIVDAVREKAAYGPAQAHMMNAIQSYPYAEGALYQVYTAVGQVTDIALAKGEVLSSVSAGDTVRWVVGDTTSGSGANLRTHILVKPIAAELNSNQVIMTDRRAYHIELHSSETSYMAAVSWHYPHEELITLQRQQRARMASNAMIAEPKLNLATMSFSYKITGDNPRWRPVRGF